MKRVCKMFFAILIAFLAIALVGCKKDKDPEKPTISFAETSLEVTVGDTFTLKPTITNLENGTIEFTFDKEGVVSLTGNTFTAESEGNVKITGTLKDYPDIKASVTVTVKAPATLDVKVTGITVRGEAAMEVGSNQTLTAVVTPENATNKAVTWTSSDTAVASVATTGIVNAIAAGKAVITATAADGSNVKGTLEITVTETNVAVTTVDFGVVETMRVGNVQDLMVVVLPANATNKGVTWQANPETVATVDQTGHVTAVAPGTVTITATAKDGSGIKCEKTITVIEFVKPEYTAVNPEWEFEELGSIVTLNGKEFEFGYSAYAQLDAALAAASKGTYVAPGEYPDNATIVSSNFELIGPNAKVDPNKVQRTDEAIITGTITIAAELENVTIKGFAFTTEGAVVASEKVHKIELSYNNVYDTNEDVADWAEGRTQVEAVFTFWSATNDPDTGDIVIKNNKFSNITESAILIARLKNVTVENNGFYNFKRDAIRGEGGYNYGEWVFEGNKFVNDEIYNL